MIEAEVVLSYENDRWRARGDGLDVEHCELRDLDAVIEGAYLFHRGLTPPLVAP